MLGECVGREWTLDCPGHWECRDGGCQAVCDDNLCTASADCAGKNWPLPCPGHYECRQGVCRPKCELPVCVEKIPFHLSQSDAQGKLLPWISFDRLIHLPMRFIEFCPLDPTTGLPWYEQYSEFRFESMTPLDWPHNPAGLCGMMVETLLRYWPYTGDRTGFGIVRQALDHLIAESTPADYLWPRVPYASADNSGTYRGGSHEGIDGIEPDKVGQAALGYLRFFKLTGETRYLDEATHGAGVLAEKVREGDESHSPWPFRVNARTGRVIEEYTADVVYPVMLFDELERLGLSTPAQAAARVLAWEWLWRYPVQNRLWKGYFEDVRLDPFNLNVNQYIPGELARYLMLRPELDPSWREHVPALIDWIKSTFGDSRPDFLGATGIREQTYCWQISSSHTARYASLCAMWSGRGGGEVYHEEARRAFALASYFARQDGIVIFSICDQSVWFSDGYFDYVPHFLDGMAALPEMAPAGEDHLLHSSSVVTNISYSPGRVAYQTFDSAGKEILRLSFIPKSILADGRPMRPLAAAARGDSIPGSNRTASDAGGGSRQNASAADRGRGGAEISMIRMEPGEGYRFDSGLKVLRIEREGSSSIVISDR